MKIRKFKMINSLGNEWNLMRKDSFLYSPEGLGVSKENEYIRIGSTYELIQSLTAQKSVNFNMLFKSYSVYSDFADFIVYTPLKIAYMPLDEWVYIDGEITSMEKTEIDGDVRRLICPCVFTASSMWYIPRAAQKTADDVQNAKKYNYTYNYAYADELNGYIRINNKGSEDSPAKITIFGPITDPAWYVSVNNTVVASGAITADIPEGHKVVINSKDGDLEIAEYIISTNRRLRNLYQYTDFDRETFVLFPPGNSVLFISGINEGSIEAWCEVEEIHETV